MRIVRVALALLCAGCAGHYVTPGGSVRLSDINREDVAAVAALKPSPHFPANIAVARVQAPQYVSHSSAGYGVGKFSLVPTQELLSDADLDGLGHWPSVAGVVTVNRLLLPTRLDSLEDLRIAAAKLHADVLLVYTVDTTFRIQGRAYGSLALISLGLVPDRDAYITSTASAVFTDVRTGYTYGAAEATAKSQGLTNVWGTRDTIDRKRLDAERQATALLLIQAATTWTGIAEQYR